MKRKEHDSLARWAMKLLCTLLGLILIAMLGLTFAFQQTLGLINQTGPVLSGKERFISAFSEIDFSELSSLTDPNRIGGVNSKIVNILLIGQDRREGESQARSDTMILCTFSRETGKLTMTSILRDLYVPIPGHGSNRINAAYAEGGIPLLTQTLQENLGLQIDGSMEVDFAQFAGIIDLLGGVEIELREDEARVINQETGSALTEGLHRLNGVQALAYSRIRNLDRDGDFSRTGRQRQVISALVAAYRQTKFSDMIPLLRQLLPMITTDMNYGQILLLAFEMVPYLTDLEIVSQRIPADGTFTDQTINGMSVLAADMEANRRILQETLLGK